MFVTRGVFRGEPQLLAARPRAQTRASWVVDEAHWDGLPGSERLRLTHLAEGAEALLARAESEQMGYREFLDLALEEERGVREGRRFCKAREAQRSASSQGPRRVRLRLPAAARRAQCKGYCDARLRRA